MTIKETSKELGNMIQQTQNNGLLGFGGDMPAFPSNFGGGMVQSGQVDIDGDSIPMNMLETEPVFDMDYKGTRKASIKKAKVQLSIMVKEIVPIALQDTKIIVDKINQDAEQLGNLYYEYEKNDKMIYACMEQVAHGEASAKLFEAYTKMQAQNTKLIAQITETQNQMRKYFIDTYLDLQQKENVDEHYGLPDHKEVKAIENKEVKEEKKEEKTNIIVGTENLIKMMAEKKKKAIMQKYQEVKDEEGEKESE